MLKLRDLELAKDLVQDTFVSAISKIDSFEKRSSLRTWLTSILNRKIIDHWRKAETRYTDPASQFFDQEKSHQHWLENTKYNSELENIETEIEKAESYQELIDCIDTLPTRWKGIITSKYLDEAESEEVCKEFEITSSNLWVIVHRAKLLLRDCLQKKH
jgi:RNA polymerase sigma-70 factor (ECF subfamily)